MNICTKFIRLATLLYHFKTKAVAVPAMPLRLWIESSLICNLRCVMCPNKDLLGAQKGVMSIELFKKIIDEAKGFVSDVYLHHRGEPLINQQLGAMIALRHHERYDGSGYPDGLAGEAIPLPARIVATADVFDALLSPRPYKPAWSFDASMAYMRVQRGRLFDPRCVDALQRGRERLRVLCERFSKAPPRPC